MSQWEFGVSQMLVRQEAAHSECVMQQSSDTGLQLQRALEQISNISTALCDIRRLYQEQVCADGIKRVCHAIVEIVYLCSSSCMLFLSSLYSG